MELAQETVEIVARGSYRTKNGHLVDLSQAIRECLAGTRFFPPEELKRLRGEVLSLPAQGKATTLEVVRETTLMGIHRLLSQGKAPVAVLNFASAKNPGGGFLNGSQAQEESLARSSALYASLLQAPAFYQRHRASPSLLYSDAMILSPSCPIFREDEGTLLETPQRVTFITSPAPNAGAAANNRPEELSRIPEVFHQRSDYLLALAASQGYQHLILGAWGCGVFRNDPALVAKTFMGHLKGGAWAGRFAHVTFSVWDTSAHQETFMAFQRAVGGAA
jgi:uncharacterized protein (TIGR02452 family)